jgi:hypothetical protein
VFLCKRRGAESLSQLLAHHPFAKLWVLLDAGEHKCLVLLIGLQSLGPIFWEGRPSMERSPVDMAFPFSLSLSNKLAKHGF